MVSDYCGRNHDFDLWLNKPMTNQPKRALMCWGGWGGHTPQQSTELFAGLLRDAGYEVEISDTLDSYLDVDKLRGLNLIVPR